jgi:hypothetical protein
LATAGRDARAIRLKGVSEMGTFILTWNPRQWDPDGATHQADLTKFRRRGSVRGQWSVGNRKRGIGPGDRAFLLRQHEGRGLVASGHFTSPIFQEPHWDGTNRNANYAKTEWDAVVDIEDCLPTEELKRRVTPFAWDRIQASGIRLPDQLAGRLEDLWRDHLSGLGLAPISIPEEVAGFGLPRGRCPAGDGESLRARPQSPGDLPAAFRDHLFGVRVRFRGHVRATRTRVHPCSSPARSVVGRPGLPSRPRAGPEAGVPELPRDAPPAAACSPDRRAAAEARGRRDGICPISSVIRYPLRNGGRPHATTDRPITSLHRPSDRSRSFVLASLRALHLDRHQRPGTIHTQGLDRTTPHR